jgi:surface protein
MIYGYGNMISATNRLFSGGGGANPNFEMTIDTTKAGSASNTFILPTVNSGTYDALIDWGDDSTSEITSWNDPDLTHVYSVGGIYNVKISGSFPQIKFANTGDKLKLMSINNWGNCGFLSLDSSFYGCSNLEIYATDTLNCSSVTNMFRCFFSCSSITSIPNFNTWDTSNVTNMSLSFRSTTSLSSLDLSGMDFTSCVNWGASGANGAFWQSGISSINLTGLLFNNSSFTFSSVFSSCSNLTTVSGFETLDFSSCTEFSYVFYSCTSLTSINLVGLDFSSCTNFYRTFYANTAFTLLDVSSWTLNSVNNISMGQMFRLCGTRNIVGLDTWNIEKVNNFSSFLINSKITTTEYDKLLIAWDSQNPVDSLTPNFGTSNYTLGSAAETARASLISTDLWTITDGGGI